MNKYESVREQFLSAVKNHSMTVLQDDGNRRHLRFSNNGSNVYRFDLVTWPGYLYVGGDISDYVFLRLPDMFEFFLPTLRADGELTINPGYWGEKCTASSASDPGNGIKAFSADAFRAMVNDWVDDWLGGIEDDSYAVTLREDVEQEVLCLAEEGEHAALSAAFAYQYEDPMAINPPFRFDNDYRGAYDFTHGFLIACFAIVWGIQQYDGAKA
jgi:hypothetical protein